MNFPFDLRRFWIRKDREQYLLSGAILTAIISSYVSAHWHFLDTVDVLRNIKISSQGSDKPQIKKIREVEYIAPKVKGGNRKYYHIDLEKNPEIPQLEETEPGPAKPK
ncbi:MAG: hypothetical protein WCK76_04140 [Elusimicrobiota bacterium]